MGKTSLCPCLALPLKPAAHCPVQLAFCNLQDEMSKLTCAHLESLGATLQLQLPHARWKTAIKAVGETGVSVLQDHAWAAGLE